MSKRKINGQKNLLPERNLKADTGLAEALQRYGLPQQPEIEAPDPGPNLPTMDAKDACRFDTEIDGANKQSGVFVLLDRPNVETSSKEGSKTFIVAPVYSDVWGELLLTTSYEKRDGGFSPLAKFIMDHVKPGQAFRFAAFSTSSGYEVLKAVQV